MIEELISLHFQNDFCNLSISSSIWDSNSSFTASNSPRNLFSNICCSGFRMNSYPIISVKFHQCFDLCLFEIMTGSSLFGANSSNCFGGSLIEEYHREHDSFIWGIPSDVSSWNSISIEWSSSLIRELYPYSCLNED